MASNHMALPYDQLCELNSACLFTSGCLSLLTCEMGESGASRRVRLRMKRTGACEVLRTAPASEEAFWKSWPAIIRPQRQKCVGSTEGPIKWRQAERRGETFQTRGPAWLRQVSRLQRIWYPKIFETAVVGCPPFPRPVDPHGSLGRLRNWVEFCGLIFAISTVQFYYQLLFIFLLKLACRFHLASPKQDNVREMRSLMCKPYIYIFF